MNTMIPAVAIAGIDTGRMIRNKTPIREMSSMSPASSRESGSSSKYAWKIQTAKGSWNAAYGRISPR
jgi:hypothetical protein